LNIEDNTPGLNCSIIGAAKSIRHIWSDTLALPKYLLGSMRTRVIAGAFPTQNALRILQWTTRYPITTRWDCAFLASFKQTTPTLGICNFQSVWASSQPHHVITCFPRISYRSRACPLHVYPHDLALSKLPVASDPACSAFSLYSSTYLFSLS